MKFDLPKLDDLKNESDVEQKLVYPLLTTEEPFGFGIGSNEILTKQNIRRLPIGKSKDRKSYFPDYLILIGASLLSSSKRKSRGKILTKRFEKRGSTQVRSTQFSIRGSIRWLRWWRQTVRGCSPVPGILLRLRSTWRTPTFPSLRSAWQNSTA